VKICVVIPTINRKDLLEECLPPLEQSKSIDKIIIIDNGKQGLRKIEKGIIFVQEANLGVAASWNLGITYALKIEQADWVLVLNDDIVMLREALDNLETNLKPHADKWLLVGALAFSTFMLSRAGAAAMEYAPNKYFDEAFFPAYYEDLDFKWRVHFKDSTKYILKLEWLKPAVFRKESSSKRNRALWARRTNKSLFLRKWGGTGRRPKFTVPYDGKIPWP
jgi:GT2 family glycosyltransferase